MGHVDRQLRLVGRDGDGERGRRQAGDGRGDHSGVHGAELLAGEDARVVAGGGGDGGEQRAARGGAGACKTMKILAAARKTILLRASSLFLKNQSSLSILFPLICGHQNIRVRSIASRHRIARE